MNINIEKGDLFDLPKSKYVFAHCIATDLRWGAGIVVPMMKEFKCGSHWRRPYNDNEYSVGSIGVEDNDIGIMVNLFTKKNTWDKPKYSDLKKSLEALRNYMTDLDYDYLAIPMIGCGLDGLEWSKVKSIIEQVFADTSIDIEVRYL